MNTWAIIIAVMIPAVVAAIIAYLACERSLFWGAVIGASIGATILRPFVVAMYDDPLDRLSTEIELALTGAIPCAIGGLAIGWIITRGLFRRAQNQGDSSPAS